MSGAALFSVLLGLTMLLEGPIYLLAFSRRSTKEKVVLWLCANIASYPAVFFIFPYLPFSPMVCELSAEVWAPVCEIAVARYLLGPLSRTEVGAVIVANLVSWLVGRVIVETVIDSIQGWL